MQQHHTSTNIYPVKRIYRATDEERFWAKVDKSGECWIWTASDVHGYGQFILSDKTKKFAHRYAYELIIGAIPENHELHHSCERRRCVNPAHLIYKSSMRLTRGNSI